MRKNPWRLFVLSLILLGAGCTAVEEREAQLEFERLQRQPGTPQGDRVIPAIGDESSSEEAYGRAKDWGGKGPASTEPFPERIGARKLTSRRS
jgi:hypothetical protein